MKWLASLQAIAGLIQRILDALEARRREDKQEAIMDDAVGEFNRDYGMRDQPGKGDTPPTSDDGAG
jgi:hypothetical protein